MIFVTVATRIFQLLWRQVKQTLQNPFTLAWVIQLLFFEVFLIDVYLFGCSYPKVSLDFREQVNAVVIADPQLTDAYSYKQSGIALKLTEFYSDIYMKRNFRRIQFRMRPQVLIFVGDLMDGGREWTDDQFHAELNRFLKIFKPRDENMKILGVAGNHDIGFGHTIISHAYQRYLNTFGSLNTLNHIANHSIIALDTMGLSGKPSSVAFKSATEFLHGLEAETLHDSSRRILLTHVPLYRPEGSYCGPRRRAKPMTNRYGYQYQSIQR